VRIRTVRDLGAAIRAQRRKLGLDQATLAERAGVSRLWINQVEAGKPGASVGLVLRTLGVLGLELDAASSQRRAVRTGEDPDINAILERARKRP
jgi:HTH-type transcriptional regulator/antitoxin HipB